MTERELVRRSVEQLLFRSTWSIGRYQVRGRLGEGGMGQVFLGWDPKVDRTVAIKVLRGSHTDEARERLRREAQSLALLNHPNVVAVYDVGLHDGSPYVAMEHVEGVTLDQWCADRDESAGVVLSVFLEAARGLAAAHAEGIVHRDFKPSNVLVGADGRPRILDFGIARAYGDVRPQADSGDFESGRPQWLDLTATDVVVGTPLYMAPEQRLGSKVDHRCDQYAFCVALYQALYGEHPFASGTDYPELVRRAHAGEIAPAPAGSVVSARLRRVIVRGLSVEPSRRHPDMHALVSALEAASRSRAGWLMAGAGGVALAGAVVLGVFVDPSSAVEPCSGGVESIAAAWDEPRRQRVGDGFAKIEGELAEQSWREVDERMAEQVGDLQRAYRQACESSPDTNELRDAQLRCVNHRERELRGFAQRLEEVDRDTVPQVTGASLRALDDPARCLDAEYLAHAVAPPPAELDDVVTRLRSSITEVRQRWELGQFARSAKLGQKVAEQAESLPYPAVLAEGLLAAGYGAFANGDHQPGVALLERAYFVASQVPHEQIKVEAALHLMIVAAELEDDDRASKWSRHARSDLERTEAPPEQWVQWHLNEGGARKFHGEYDRAREHLERALALAEAGPPQARIQIQILTALGVTLGELGSFQAGLARLDEAKALAEDALIAGHPERAAIYDSIGAVRSAMHEPDNALAAAETSLAIRRAALHPEHLDIAQSEYNVAHELWMLNRLDEALEHAQIAQRIEVASRATQGRAAVTRRLVVRILRDNGKGEEALRLLRKERQEVESSLGPDHPRLVGMGIDIGDTQFQLGDFDGAVKTFRRTAEVAKRALGPNHLKVAVVHDRIGIMLYQAGRTEEALAAYRESIRIREQNPESPTDVVVIALANEAAALTTLGRSEEAIPSLRRAVELARTLPPLPGNAVLLCASTQTLGVALSRSGTHDEAASVLADAVSVAETLEPPELGTRLGSTLTTLGKHWLLVGEPHKARPVLERAVKVPRPAPYDRGHVANSKFALARALVEVGEERERAVALAKEAAAEWAELGSWSGEHAEAEKWLRRHGR